MQCDVQAQAQHQWLKQLIGKWTFESECVMGPEQPPSRSGGSETVRAIGDLWVVCDGAGEMPGGGSCTTQMTLGFDPRLRRYVGTWIGSMMDLLWQYQGDLDAGGGILTLNAQGPSFSGDGSVVSYQDIIEIVSADHRMLRSQVQQADGSWQHFMTANYHRVG